MNENSMSAADYAAIMNGNGGYNNFMNNPFFYLIWLAYMGNGGFGGFGNNAGAQAVETNAKLNALSQQISDNQNTNTLGGAINANHEALNGLLGAVNLGFAGTNAAINNASMQTVMGQKDAAAQMASCCCDIKTNILNQTNALQGQIAQLANGVAQGFSQVGYAQAQQTNILQNTANANTQRIIDQLNAQTTNDLRDKLFDMSQQAQTASIVSQLKTTA